jgi:hypothetical protein
MWAENWIEEQLAEERAALDERIADARSSSSSSDAASSSDDLDPELRAYMAAESQRVYDIFSRAEEAYYAGNRSTALELYRSIQDDAVYGPKSRERVAEIENAMVAGLAEDALAVTDAIGGAIGDVYSDLDLYGVPHFGGPSIAYRAYLHGGDMLEGSSNPWSAMLTYGDYRFIVWEIRAGYAVGPAFQYMYRSGDATTLQGTGLAMGGELGFSMAEGRWVPHIAFGADAILLTKVDQVDEAPFRLEDPIMTVVMYDVSLGTHYRFSDNAGIGVLYSYVLTSAPDMTGTRATFEPTGAQTTIDRAIGDTSHDFGSLSLRFFWNVQ